MKGKKKKKIIKRIVKKSSGRTVLQIVKRKGHTELYDERKVYGSCFFACRNAHLSGQQSEAVCSKVAASVTKSVRKRKIVSSNYIFKLLTQELKKHNDDAAFLYETHRDIS